MGSCSASEMVPMALGASVLVALRCQGVDVQAVLNVR